MCVSLSLSLSSVSVSLSLPLSLILCVYRCFLSLVQSSGRCLRGCSLSHHLCLWGAGWEGGERESRKTWALNALLNNPTVPSNSLALITRPSSFRPQRCWCRRCFLWRHLRGLPPLPIFVSHSPALSHCARAWF